MNFRNSTQTFIVIVLILVSGFGGYFAGKNEIKVKWEKYKPDVSVRSLEPPPGIDQNIDFRLFWDVVDRLQKGYIEKSAIDMQKMYYGAISGMVAALGDPYTVFLPPQQNKEVKEELAGHFDGIGAQLGVKDKKIVVIAPLKDSPAEKAGIKPSDWIVKVDGKDTLAWTLPEAVSKIRGPKGTKVKLTILHEGEQKPIDVEVVRDTIVIKSVEWTQKESSSSGQEAGVADGKEPASTGKQATKEESLFDQRVKNGKRVAVIKLSRFGEGTDDEWQKVVTEVIRFKEDNRSTFGGIVLDLRNNPGGFLTGAVFIASEFLADGTVVMQENSKGERQVFSVNRIGRLTKEPLIAIINKGSASASEIVAGALKDRGRAKLVGEKSFGKGTIQEAQDLAEGAGLHITTAKWLTPNGNWVNDTEGLVPDIEVKPDEKDPNRDVQLEKAMDELVK